MQRLLVINGVNFSTVVFLILLATSVALYFLPSIIAAHRAHHNSTAILMLNLLLGWTALGWVIAMVWACTEVRQPAGQMPPRWSADYDKARGVDEPSRW